MGIEEEIRRLSGQRLARAEAEKKFRDSMPERERQLAQKKAEEELARLERIAEIRSREELVATAELTYHQAIVEPLLSRTQTALSSDGQAWTRSTHRAFKVLSYDYSDPGGYDDLPKGQFVSDYEEVKGDTLQRERLSRLGSLIFRDLLLVGTFSTPGSSVGMIATKTMWGHARRRFGRLKPFTYLNDSGFVSVTRFELPMITADSAAGVTADLMNSESALFKRLTGITEAGMIAAVRSLPDNLHLP